jgi:hypothetical protein
MTYSLLRAATSLANVVYDRQTCRFAGTALFDILHGLAVVAERLCTAGGKRAVFSGCPVRGSPTLS